MPRVIQSLGNCTCEEWNEHAMDLSDRIVFSLADGPDLYKATMFEFCPYCGRKLVQAGAGHKNVGMWEGKSLLGFNHQELINIINRMSEDMRRLRDDFTERIGNMIGDP